MCLHLCNECPLGTTYKKQRWGTAAPDTTSVLLHFLCRKTENNSYSKSKYFISRHLLKQMLHLCHLTLSRNGVLPASISGNKAIQQNKRKEKFRMTSEVEDTEVVVKTHLMLKFIKDQDHSFTKGPT